MKLLARVKSMYQEPLKGQVTFLNSRQDLARAQMKFFGCYTLLFKEFPCLDGFHNCCKPEKGVWIKKKPPRQNFLNQGKHVMFT